MKLKPMKIVKTPRNWDEITDFTAATKDPAASMMAAMMAWNLACSESEKKGDES
mgnify:CR=1 FL=1